MSTSPNPQPEGHRPAPTGRIPGRAFFQQLRDRFRNALSTRRQRSVGLAILLLAVGGGVYFWWQHTSAHISSDNVYVAGNITPISAEVSGTVVVLYVDDNMVVRAGDPVAQIDPIPFQWKLDQALADFKQAQFDLAAAEVNVRLVQEDRKSLLAGTEARKGEADRAAEAAAVEVQTRTQINQKDKELLAALQAEKPGLEAIAKRNKELFERIARLADTGDVTGQDRDNRLAAFRDADARLKSLQSRIAGAESQALASGLQLTAAKVRLEQSRKAVDNASAVVGQAKAAQLQPAIALANASALRNKKDQAEAKLRLARLNLSNTLIRAPQAGIISRRTIQLGQTLEARQPFLSIVPLDLDNVWVVANLREEQMKKVRVGQPAVITVDGIPERVFAGWVESVAGGTGSVFSLFPPDNATGNFVRVVQRLPVRIRFNDTENFQNRLRPGMSARVTIDTTRLVRESSQEW